MESASSASFAAMYSVAVVFVVIVVVPLAGLAGTEECIVMAISLDEVVAVGGEFNRGTSQIQDGTN